MMKYSYAIAAFFLTCTAAFGRPAVVPLSPGLAEKVKALYGFSDSDMEALKTAGEITRFQDGSFTGLILPDAKTAGAITAEMKTLDPKILVEALFIVPVEPRTNGDGELRLHMYNTLRAVSTMKGIQYYSASRERMRVMFTDAYAIKDEESRKPLPDPVAKTIPPDSTLYIYQHDSSFGRNSFEARYTYDEDTFRVSMKNLTVMHYGILPLVQPERLHLELVILPAADHLVFYGCIGVDTFSMFGMRKKAIPSFYNRVKALYSWFVGNF